MGSGDGVFGGFGDASGRAVTSHSEGVTRAYEVAQTLRESLSRAPWLLGYKVQGERALAELERLAGEAEGLRKRVAFLEREYVVRRRQKIDAETKAKGLRDLLARCRPYVAEPGPPGTVIETTEDSAARSSALLAEINAALEGVE